MSLCYNIAEAVCKGGKNGLDCSSHTGGCTNGLLLIGRKGSNIISGFFLLIIAFNRWKGCSLIFNCSRFDYLFFDYIYRFNRPSQALYVNHC